MTSQSLKLPLCQFHLLYSPVVGSFTANQKFPSISQPLGEFVYFWGHKIGKRNDIFHTTKFRCVSQFASVTKPKQTSELCLPKLRIIAKLASSQNQVLSYIILFRNRTQGHFKSEIQLGLGVKTKYLKGNSKVVLTCDRIQNYLLFKPTRGNIQLSAIQILILLQCIFLSLFLYCLEDGTARNHQLSLSYSVAKICVCRRKLTHGCSHLTGVVEYRSL